MRGAERGAEGQFSERSSNPFNCEALGGGKNWGCGVFNVETATVTTSKW